MQTLLRNKIIIASTSALLLLFLSGCGEDQAKGAQVTTLDQQSTSASHDDHGDDDGHGDHGEESEKHEEGHSDHDEEGGDVVRMDDMAAKGAGIKLSRAAVGPMGQVLKLPAEVRFDADRVANVSPKVSGVIAKLYVSEGDDVSRGDALAMIRSRELAALKASWIKANSREKLAAQALAREESLFAEKITSEADLQTARANHQAAKAERDAAENELHAAGVTHAALQKIASANDGDNANAYLTAPITGTVVRRTVTLGETVSAGDAGAAPLFTIVDDSVVWADIAVYKQDISLIREGAPVVLKTDSGLVLARSTVAFLLPVINETSRTATARVIVDNPDGALLPGQFIVSEISVGSTQDVLRIPQSALQLVEDKPSVFVPVDDGFAPVPVSVGRKSGGYVEIKAGLAPGDPYVLDGAFTLKAQLEKDAFGDGHGH